MNHTCLCSFSALFCYFLLIVGFFNLVTMVSSCNLSHVLQRIEDNQDGRVAILKAVVGEVSTVLNCKNEGKLLLIAMFDENCVKRLLVYNENLFSAFVAGHLVRVTNCVYKSGEFVVSSNSNSATAAKLMKVAVPAMKLQQCHSLLYPMQQTGPIKDLKPGQFVALEGVVQQI